MFRGIREAAPSKSDSISFFPRKKFITAHGNLANSPFGQKPFKRFCAPMPDVQFHLGPSESSAPESPEYWLPF